MRRSSDILSMVLSAVANDVLLLARRFFAWDTRSIRIAFDLCSGVSLPLLDIGHELRGRVAFSDVSQGPIPAEPI